MSNDVLDDLLQRAFDADLARTPAGRTAERVLARIERQRRLHRTTVAGAAAVGLAGVLPTLPALWRSGIDPLLERLIELGAGPWSVAWSSEPAMMLLLAGVAGAALLAAEWSRV